MTTTTSASLPSDHSTTYDFRTTLGAAFFGFSIGAILFGITVRQAYQYYTINTNDSKIRKGIIAFVCVLDTLHLVFSMYMVYCLILQLLGDTDAGKEVVWSLKALATSQVLLVVFVQGFYLFQIWRLSSNLLLPRRFTLAVQVFVVFIAFLAIAVTVVFMSSLQKMEAILSFSAGFEYVVYLGFGTTALIDCAIAGAMSLILYKSSRGTLQSETVLESLIQHFVATGLLTSFAAIMVIVLYVAQPHSLLYLGMEFSNTRLYANSVLAMFNSRKQLRGQLEQSIELKLPSNVFFTEPENLSRRSSFMDPYASGSETKYSPGADTTFEREHMLKDSKDGSGRSYTV